MHSRSLSRRQFAHAAGAVAAAGAAGWAEKPPLTASAMIERIKQQLKPPPDPRSPDGFKAGDPNTPVTGIATTFLCTLDVLQRSAALGSNLVITHEPMFWNGPDKLDQLRDDPVYQYKAAFIERNHMVVWRVHNGIHAHKPDMIWVGWTKALGWDKYQVAPQSTTYELPPTTVEAIVEHLARRLKTRSIRLIGDPKLPVTRVRQGGHHALNTKTGAAPNCDALILYEAPESDSAEYVRDAIASGQKLALILIAHECGEESGMDLFAGWLRSFVTEVPVRFVPAGDAFWTPE